MVRVVISAFDRDREDSKVITSHCIECPSNISDAQFLRYIKGVIDNATKKMEKYKAAKKTSEDTHHSH